MYSSRERHICLHNADTPHSTGKLFVYHPFKLAVLRCRATASLVEQSLFQGGRMTLLS